MTYTGIVQRYSKRGHALGFPTANIHLDDPEPSGSYIARVTVNGVEHPAAVFADQARHLLEAHILDFSDELYGREISIELLHKLREPEMFQHDEALKAAIAGDVAKVRAYFKN